MRPSDDKQMMQGPAVVDGAAGFVREMENLLEWNDDTLRQISAWGRKIEGVKPILDRFEKSRRIMDNDGMGQGAAPGGPEE